MFGFPIKLHWHQTTCPSLLFLTLLFSTTGARAQELHIAVASNFTDVMSELIDVFESESGIDVEMSSSSTGKHYAQILHGAPFDIFFAADVERPLRLEEERIGVADTRFTYAIGRLVLWSRQENVVDSNGDILREGSFRHLAIANPDLAPYGRAAQEVLESRGLWKELQPRLVRGENIGQTFHFVESGNAELGFVAWSQLKRPEVKTLGSYWEVPPDLHAPIEQQAILLRESEPARQFMAFVRGENALKIIHKFGYDTPDAK